MKMQCPECGQWLELPGRAATCPNCGTLVTIPVSPAPPPARIIKDEPGTTYEHAPRYAPSAIAQQMPDWLRATIVIGIVAIFAFSTIFFVIWRIKVKLAGVTTPVAAPVSPPPPATSSTGGERSGSPLFDFSGTQGRQSSPSQGKEPPAEAGGPREVAPGAGEQRRSPATPAPLPPRSATSAARAPATRSNTASRIRPQPVEAPAGEAVTDEVISAAILKGAEYLMSRFENGRLREASGERTLGTNALCVLALLHAGQAVSDERLNVHNPFLSYALDTLRDMPLPQTLLTYTRSLRAQALAVYNRAADRSVLEADARWLIGASVRGAYGYIDPPTGATQPEAVQWDNSNSQYGVLGVWAAAEAGVAVPLSYWQDVQSHWERTQSKDGGWGYTTAHSGTLSMTSAGVNMLFVANEMISAHRPSAQIARPPFSPHLQAGLDWLAKDDNAIDLSSNWGYTLYGLERAGLASGFKMLGKHDWFRVLAAEVLKKQAADGSWGDDVETSFAILFLSRGRHPLMMNKLHFIGPWANRPRDLAKVARFTSRETERAMNWQVVSMRNAWSDWMDAPILYLASHEAPIFDESDFDKLASFIRAGGLLFTNADGASKEFNQFAEILAMRLFEGEEMKDLPENHFIYTALFRPGEKIPLRGVSNATRTLMIHSPTDIARRWQGSNPRSDRPPFEIAANMFIYATGMSVPRNRLDTLARELPAGMPSATIPIARVRHAGNWDPEPWAWQRMARVFRRDTNVALGIVPIEAENLSTKIAPIAHLTGTSTFSLSDAQVESLKKYVDAGGVLLIDPCGGSPEVAQSIRDNILARAFADKQPAPLKAEHALLTRSGDGMIAIPKPQARPYVFSVMGQRFTHPSLLESGNGAVIISDLDITSGLLGTNTLGIIGYDQAYAQALVSNIILWTVNGRGGAPMWNNASGE